MRLRKIVATGIIVTVIAAGHVHQRVETVKVSYDLQKNRRHLARLIDQNSKLTYNLSKMESAKFLLTSLSEEEIKFASHRMAREGSYRLSRAGSDDGVAKAGIISRFLKR